MRTDPGSGGRIMLHDFCSSMTWFSVRERTYRTITIPNVRVEASQIFHPIDPVWEQYFTKKLLV